MSISVADATSVDRSKLVEILCGEHVQAAVPEVVEREIIERTVASNLEISGNEPFRLVFIKAQVGEITAGLGLARRGQYGKYALEVVVGDSWLRRSVASSLIVELNRRCRELGAAATYAHIFPENSASIALVEKLGFELKGRTNEGTMLEFVKML